jgi:hypothetical protein
LKLSVFVLDRHGKALMPCTEKRARLLLARGRARVHRVLPFVIRLVDVRLQDCEVQPLRIKLDPGSQTTGIALVREKILKGVWGENYFGDVKIVDVNIRRLRMKVEDEPSHPAHILTVWGYGYRWEE